MKVYFGVNIIRPTRLMATNFPPETEATDGDEILLTIEVSEANPKPTILWFLNTGYLSIQFVSKKNNSAIRWREKYFLKVL